MLKMSKCLKTTFTRFERDCLDRGGLWELHITLDFQSESVSFAHGGSEGSIGLEFGD